MLLLEDKEIDLFVASRIGSFKHIKYHTDVGKNKKKCIENLVDIKSLQKDDSILCMEWGNKEQTEILLARKNRKIEIYDTEIGFRKSYSVNFGEGNIIGVARCSKGILAGVASGVIQIWDDKDFDIENPIVIQTGGKLDRVKVWKHGDMFATGGEENDLKVWKIDEKKPIFIAKNLPHDWLQLRRPIWVTDLTFLEENLLAVCSRHGYVRLYDTRIQRRPITHIETPGMAATCIANGFDERQVFVGFGRGHLHQVDFTKSRLDKGYKGAAGAITSIALCEQERLIVSSSLDRHLRVHERDSKNCVYKQYLTSKLAQVLVQSQRNTALKVVIKDESDVEPLETVKLDQTDELDDIFETMETISETRKKPSSEPHETEAKKLRPSLEGSTVETSEDAILKLLKSTEKTRKKREKIKREKKQKSLFYNA
ncbi:WD repeat-containing protein 74 [Pieris brassicae]|uniref:WD repeat-containing protein 74 n=1 Tax=Pieris brassicae TaxID=7116 RepID=UPI001E66160A|nr:WD repeat-containing protein 74 [Pieris brassicae]